MEAEEIRKLINEILKEKEKNNMDANYSRTNIDDFLTVRGFGGYGGGYGGYGGGGGGGIYTGNQTLGALAHADGTGTGENVKANRQFVEYGHAKLSREHEDIVRNDQFHLLSRENSDIRMLISANAREASECCCKNREEMQKGFSDIKEKILQTSLDEANQKLVSCEAARGNENQTAVLLAAILGDGNDHGRK